MFQKFKKSFAKAALVALAIQMAVMLAPTGAHADASSVNLLTNMNSVQFVTGQDTDFYFNVSNPGTVAYTGNTALILSGDQTMNIGTHKQYNPVAKAWEDLTVTFDGTDTILSDTAVELTAGYSVTTDYRLSFIKPQDYTFSYFGAGTSTEGDSFSLTGLSYIKTSVEAAMITSTLPTVVGMGVDVPFTATLDNTFGSSHTVDANLLIKDALVADITKLTVDGSNILPSLTQTGSDVVATFPGAITAGTVYTYNFVINFATEKVYGFELTVVDAATEIAKTVGSVSVDGTGPTVTFLATSPTNLKVIPVTVVFSEAVTGLELTDIVVGNGTAQNLSGSGVQYKFEVVPSGTAVEQNITLDLAAGAVIDLVGNPNIASSRFVINYDAFAPAAVKDLAATVNENGSVVLTWTNPADSYTGLQVKRDGVFLTTLPVGTTTFTDTSAVRGQTYSYTVTAFDAAGNVSEIAPISVTVPELKVAAVVSDSTNYVPVDTTVKDRGTITSADNSADTKGDEKKKEEGLPFWAIMLLVILAAVGGYLIYNQKPVAPVVAPVAKKATNEAPKKITPKKKK
jgi:hypothetical protein